MKIAYRNEEETLSSNPCKAQSSMELQVFMEILYGHQIVCTLPVTIPFLPVLPFLSHFRHFPITFLLAPVLLPPFTRPPIHACITIQMRTHIFAGTRKMYSCVWFAPDIVAIMCRASNLLAWQIANQTPNTKCWQADTDTERHREC